MGRHCALERDADIGAGPRGAEETNAKQKRPMGSRPANVFLTSSNTSVVNNRANEHVLIFL